MIYYQEGFHLKDSKIFINLFKKYMRHRMGIASMTGLGNPNSQIIDGRLSKSKKLNKIIKKCSKDAYNIFFVNTKIDFGHCDAQINFDMSEIRIGVEPAYMYEGLKIITICKKKEVSNFMTGYAWGVYGSDISSTTMYYSEYKNKSKFVKFVDNWHDKIFIK